MKNKSCYNVLAVYSLRHCAGREHFSGILDAMSNTSNWHLSMLPPELFVSRRELTNEFGEPFDGFILSMPGSDEVMARIAQSHVPTVLVDVTDRRFSSRCDAIATIWADNADAGRRAAQHLLDRGTYAITGYVHEIDRRFDSVERMTAFRQTMKRHGYETSVFPNDDDSRNFFKRLKIWVRALPKPAAIMAASDMRAADVINACREEGVDVPEQVSVIGVDHDISQHAKCGMSISSVILNSREKGCRAVQELDFLFKHPKWNGRTHEILIPAKGVFVGESTSLSVPASRLVNVALQFIAANVLHKISPDDVATYLGCSRRLVELRFSQICQTTIHKAINNARLNEVQRRIQLGESVYEIVKAMHFSSANQLYQIYKRHFGRTIRQFTEQTYRS